MVTSGASDLEWSIAPSAKILSESAVELQLQHMPSLSLDKMLIREFPKIRSADMDPN